MTATGVLGSGTWAGSERARPSVTVPFSVADARVNVLTRGRITTPVTAEGWAGSMVLTRGQVRAVTALAGKAQVNVMTRGQVNPAALLAGKAQVNVLTRGAVVDVNGQTLQGRAFPRVMTRGVIVDARGGLTFQRTDSAGAFAKPCLRAGRFARHTVAGGFSRRAAHGAVGTIQDSGGALAPRSTPGRFSR